jgi:hypothetical protein
MLRVNVVPENHNAGDSKIIYFYEPFELYKFLRDSDEKYFTYVGYNITMFPRTIKDYPKMPISYIKTNFPFSGKISFCRVVIRKDLSMFVLRSTPGFTVRYCIIFSHGLICLISAEIIDENFRGRTVSNIISTEIKKMVLGGH